jgi:hypothetical protein
MSCPYTSTQNGKAELITRSVNNVIRTLLIQASLLRRYWAEGLHTATYLLNRLPTTAIQVVCPHLALFGSVPSYDYLRVFGCTCYPNMTDIAYAVQQIYLHMHDPREPHLTSMKHILRYLKGTPYYGLVLRRSSSSDIVVYTDADWVGCPDTRRSTSGYAVFLGDNLVSWSAKRQTVVSRSSAEAEYHAVANGVAEVTWLRQLLHELHTPPSRCTLVYCDNISAVYLSNPVHHQCTKHVEIDLHFVREKVAISQVRVLHVLTTSQFADSFTRGSPPRYLMSFSPVSTSCSG